jgi:hypothetical protein
MQVLNIMVQLTIKQTTIVTFLIFQFDLYAFEK